MHNYTFCNCGLGTRLELNFVESTTKQPNKGGLKMKFHELPKQFQVDVLCILMKQDYSLNGIVDYINDNDNFDITYDEYAQPILIM